MSARRRPSNPRSHSGRSQQAYSIGDDMIRGYADSASIWGVIAALSYEKVKQWPNWTGQSAVEVTCALINDHLLEIAPGPEPYSGAMGPYDHAMRRLVAIVSDASSNDAWRQKAENRVKRWVGQRHGQISTAYAKLREDRNLTEWLDWSIPNAWVWHSAMLDGLFNRQFIHEVARILGCSEGELQKIWQRSRDLNQVEYWSKKQPDSDDFRLAREAYMVAALLRGRYHDHVAEEANLQILHHPFRYTLLPKKVESTAFVPTNTEMALTSIILASALGEKKVEGRISLWADNVIKAREGVRAGAVDLRQKTSGALAEDLAIDSANRLGLETYPPGRVRDLDDLFTFVSGLSWFGLSTWLGIPPVVGLPIPPAAKRVVKSGTGKSPGELITSWLYQRKGRLRNLARAVPGRIRGRWV